MKTQMVIAVILIAQGLISCSHNPNILRNVSSTEDKEDCRVNSKNIRVCVGDEIYYRFSEPYYRYDDHHPVKLYLEKIVALTKSDAVKANSDLFLPEYRLQEFHSYYLLDQQLCLYPNDKEKLCVGSEFENAEGKMDKIIAYGTGETYFQGQPSQKFIIKTHDGKTKIITKENLLLRYNKIFNLDQKTSLKGKKYIFQTTIKKEERTKEIIFSKGLELYKNELRKNNLNNCETKLSVEPAYFRAETIDLKNCKVDYIKGKKRFNLEGLLPVNGEKVFEKDNDSISVTCDSESKYACTYL